MQSGPGNPGNPDRGTRATRTGEPGQPGRDGPKLGPISILAKFSRGFPDRVNPWTGETRGPENPWTEAGLDRPGPTRTVFKSLVGIEGNPMLLYQRLF